MEKKSIEEMVRQFSPEEWRQRIENGMKELGLVFSDTVEETYMPLFPESYTDESRGIHVPVLKKANNSIGYMTSSKEESLVIDSIYGRKRNITLTIHSLNAA